MKIFGKKVSHITLTAFIGLFVAAVAYAAHSYFQGFEVDTTDWSADVTRVESGTNGIVSASGSWHAQAVSGAFTRWGGYSTVFPTDGYVTSVDIWLDPEGTTAPNDTRFDFSSAINNAAGSHRRDFVFNAGFYNDSDTTGTGRRFVVSASNNAGRSNAFPKNPGRNPFAITVDGWYTFEHTFRNNSGVLAVDLKIRDEAGVTLHSWTLSDSSDTIPANVGGNRYGWFVLQEFSFLAIDNTSKFDVRSTPSDKDQCKKGGWSLLVNGANEDFRNQGQCVKYVTTGN